MRYGFITALYPDAEVTAIYAADQTKISGEIGRWKFDEAAGATASDATHLGHNGAVVRAGWSHGRIGAALKLDGVNSRVDIPPAALAPLDKQVTITLWLRAQPVNSAEHCVLEALDANGGPVIRVWIGNLLTAFDASFGGAESFPIA